MLASSGSSVKDSVGINSDAGHPVIGDAGYRVIASVLEEGFQLEVIAGVSAA